MGERPKYFPLKSGSAFLLNIVLEVPARAIMQEKIMKDIQIGKEKCKIICLQII
jgi:hypothetical protein